MSAQPVPPLIPEDAVLEDESDYEREEAQPDEQVVYNDAEPDLDEFDTAFDIEFDTEMLSIADLLAIADLPVEAGTEEIQREIRERAALPRARNSR
jgi:hypothetical protein